MVLGEVGEDRHREVDRIGPVELERVGGHLDRAGDVASVEHLPERSLQVDRLGGGALDRALGATDHALDCPQQTGLASVRLQQRLDQECRGRLAVGAGHADRLKARGRVAVKGRRGRRHRRPDARHSDLWNAQIEGTLDDQRRGAPGDRVGRELMTVAGEPGHAEEQRSRGHAAVVVGETGDLDVPRGRWDLGDQLAKSHLGSRVAFGAREYLAARSAVCLRLKLEQLRIAPPDPHEFVVVPRLDDVPLVHHIDPVHIPHR